MARAHEQVGLRKPAHGTSEMRAIDGEDLEILPVQVSHPARNIGCLAIPGIYMGIPVGSQPGLANRELIQFSETKPRLIASFLAATYGRHEVPHDGHGQNHAHHAVKEQSKPHEERASRGFGGWRHGISFDTELSDG